MIWLATNDTCALDVALITTAADRHIRCISTVRSRL